jgi:hypothetical protein
MRSWSANIRASEDTTKRQQNSNEKRQKGNGNGQQNDSKSIAETGQFCGVKSAKVAHLQRKKGGADGERIANKTKRKNAALRAKGSPKVIQNSARNRHKTDTENHNKSRTNTVQNNAAGGAHGETKR